jgi:uncharacterized protein YjbI with pentapeptide repeats
MESEGCSFVEADLYDSVLTRVAFDHCDLRGCDFSAATAPQVVLVGSRLEGVRGAAALRRAVITADQAIPLGLSLVGGLEVEIADDD